MKKKSWVHQWMQIGLGVGVRNAIYTNNFWSFLKLVKRFIVHPYFLVIFV